MPDDLSFEQFICVLVIGGWVIVAIIRAMSGKGS